MSFLLFGIENFLFLSSDSLEAFCGSGVLFFPLPPRPPRPNPPRPDILKFTFSTYVLNGPDRLLTASVCIEFYHCPRQCKCKSTIQLLSVFAYLASNLSLRDIRRELSTIRSASSRIPKDSTSTLSLARSLDVLTF